MNWKTCWKSNKFNFPKNKAVKIRISWFTCHWHATFILALKSIRIFKCYENIYITCYDEERAIEQINFIFIKFKCTFYVGSCHSCLDFCYRYPSSEKDHTAFTLACFIDVKSCKKFPVVISTRSWLRTFETISNIYFW